MGILIDTSSFGYAYCIEAHLGDGICQDYNNLPSCEFDRGDCCDQLNGNCCQRKCEWCECKEYGLCQCIPCDWPQGSDGQEDTTCEGNY